MCRIYGYFNTTASPHELRTAQALQRHGGPDGAGLARGPGYALGSTRLAIMDPGAGRQPYVSPDGTVKVVFNGEIYNHDALREDLRGRGFTFPDHCDGSILPALYRVYGDAFAERLDGMYAIAVLDLRGAPRLVLATDDAGMKPLYYRWDPAGRTLHFSSEIPSLLAFEGVSTAAWEPGLDAYLATKTPFGEQTMFADIRVFPPGVTAICDGAAGLRLRTRERAAATRPETGPADLAVVGAELRESLRREVDRLLTADVPVATITSGGLDSSLVTAFAARRPGTLHTFNIAYRGRWPADERHYARQVAERAGAHYHQVEIDPATFPDMLADVVWHLGQPNADPITLSTYALFGAVRDAGFKVALSGDAADEVFGGYERMRAAAAAAEAGAPWRRAYLDSLGVLPADRRAGLYTRDYAALLREGPPAVPAEATELLDRGGTVLRRITEFELRHRLPAYHLRRVDHMSMARSVEVRLPYCQRGVVELGRALPDGLRIGGGQVKRALYAAARGLLPESVTNRAKQPFTLPVTAMLAPGWPLWEYARDMLADDRLRPAGRLDPAAVRDLFTRQATRPDDTTALTIWALLVYEVWLDQFRLGTRRPVEETEMAA